MKCFQGVCGKKYVMVDIDRLDVSELNIIEKIEVVTTGISNPNYMKLLKDFCFVIFLNTGDIF